MPRAPTITLDDVRTIANRLEASGVKPNPRLILEQHGSGSLGTIHPLFKQWEGEKSGNETALTLSPQLQRALLDSMRFEIAAAKALLEAKLAESEHRASDLARENERQAQMIDAYETDSVLMKTEIAALTGKIDQLDIDLAVAREETSRERMAAELARTELAMAKAQLDTLGRLEAESNELKNSLDQERQLKIVAEQLVAVLTSQKHDLSARLVDEKERLDHSNRELKATASELASTKVAVQAGQARLESAARELELLKISVKDARAEAKEATSQAAELRGKFGTGNAK